MITKKPQIKDSYKKELIFTDSARDGWGMVLNSLPSTSKILLPSYIGITDREGSGIYDPVKNSGLAHDFYALNDDLSISIDVIEYHLKKESYKLILLVHYFGFKIQNINEIVTLCKQYNVVVVEDCAHLYNLNLHDYSDVGNFGDYAFYSLHKNFPFDNGGILVQNGSKVCVKLEIKHKTGFNENLMCYNASEIAKKRIDNYNKIDLLIKSVKGVKPLKVIKKGDIPHTYPILVENGLREKLYFWLIDKNITLIALYYRLIPELQNEMFTNMKFISDNILNLPIHQDISNNDINIMIDKIKEFYE